MSGALVFDDVFHVAYRLRPDGTQEPYTRMTSALKCLGAVDATEFTEASRLRGTKVHEAVLLDYLGGLVEGWIDPAYLPYWNGYKAFKREHRFVATTMEQEVADDVLRYCGKLDAFGVFEDLAVGHDREVMDLYDVKVSATGPKHVGLQTMGYRRCLWNAPDLPHPTRVRRWMLLLPGNDRFKLVGLNMGKGNRVDVGIDAYHERVALGAIALAQWKDDPR